MPVGVEVAAAATLAAPAVRYFDSSTPQGRWFDGEGVLLEGSFELGAGGGG